MAKVLGVLVAALTAWGSAAWADEHGSWQQLENNPSCSVWNAYPQPNETVTWSGACTNGKAQGRGTAVRRYLQDGEWIEDKYTVEIKDGKGHGHGLLVFGNGDRYEGDVRDSKLHGRGVRVWAAGASYEGEFRDGKRTGRGVYVTANGDRYEGDFRDGKQHGRGVEVWGPDSKWAGNRYEGEYRHGKRHGRGVWVGANGDRYEGEYRDGKPHGRGVEVWGPDSEWAGDRYEGEYRQ